MKVPTVSIIVAMTSKQVIGDPKGLPWHLPEDLQLFKRKTLGAAVVMGRKTYQSIGRPLPGRHNIVLSRTHETFPGVKVCQSFAESLTEAARHCLPVFVIGGTEVYREALPVATDLHISWVEKNVTGDILFPDFDLDDWTVCKVTEYPGFKYVHYQRDRLP